MDKNKENKPTSHTIESIKGMQLSHGARISEIEEKVLKYWQENKIFEKSVDGSARLPSGGLIGNPSARLRTSPSKRLRAGSPKDYVFFDGPPFATGLPHYGHIVASVIKDAIPRYQTMLGKRVERKWGWDCHGLPIENIVEQKLNLKTKKDIEKYGVEKFNEEARKEVMKYVDDWKQIIPRIGRWVDMENDYKTMDTDYTESVWWVFKNLFDKKLIYEGYKSMHICPRCETTLSNFEVALGYKDIEDLSVVAKFALEDEPGTFVLAWTTTPWTLPGNVALAVNPKIEYVLIKLKAQNSKVKTEEKYILARERLALLDKDDFDILEIIKGEKLIGKKYKPLFDDYENWRKDYSNFPNGWKIYGADFVKTDEGTGIVHIAPAFGADDMALGKKHNLPFIQHVGMDGKFKSILTGGRVGEFKRSFEGMDVKPKRNPMETDEKIADFLNKKSKLLKSEIISHSYPHCWRCDTPLLNYATTSWFVDVTKIKKGKDGLIENNKEIDWIPGHIKEGRFGKILEEAPDWAISRSRYWGAPLPVWRCEKCKAQKVIGSIEDLKQGTKKSGNNYFVMRHGESESNKQNIAATTLETAAKFPLTNKGRKEVLKTARLLKNEKIDLIISSDFLRTKETAEIVAQKIGIPKGRIIFDKRLREINVGIFDNRNGRDYEKYTATWKDKLFKKPLEGESLMDVKKRTGEFIYEIDSKYKDKNILIVSHGDALWGLVATTYGADADKMIKTKDLVKEFSKTGEVRKLEFVPLPHNDNYELDLHRPYIDKVEFSCHCGGEMKRVDYVFDCWFESGSMPYGQSHYPFENKKKFEENFPAEFIAEGLDQTRGWFYTMLVLGTSLFAKPAYKNVVVNGIILAENGQKMSKRLKNYPDPMEVVQKYGADALRYYLLASPVVRAEDLNFSEKGVDEIYKKLILRLANVQSFYSLYSEGVKSRALKPESENILDQWIVARLNMLGSEVKKAMDNYELDKAVRPIAEFIDDMSTWYIRRSRERFKTIGKDKNNATITTAYVLDNFSKIIAPFMPFMAEWLNFQLGNKESVHLKEWPNFKSNASQQKLIEQMKEVRGLASLGLEAREKVGIRVRQPLNQLRIKSKEMRVKNNKELLKVLAEEINVKEIIFDPKIYGEVEVDTFITPELKEEGLLRDLTRMVQGLRQEAKYTPKDKINLWIEASKELEFPITSNQKDFKEKIGAQEIEFKKTDKFDAEIKTNIDGKPIWAAIKKI